MKSGSRTFAVYSISVNDINNNTWSIKRRCQHSALYLVFSFFLDIFFNFSIAMASLTALYRCFI